MVGFVLVGSSHAICHLDMGTRGGFLCPFYELATSGGHSGVAFDEITATDPPFRLATPGWGVNGVAF